MSSYITKNNIFLLHQGSKLSRTIIILLLITMTILNKFRICSLRQIIRLFLSKNELFTQNMTMGSKVCLDLKLKLITFFQ